MYEDRGRRVFRFGAFEASEAAGELRKHGIRIKIHAQPFQVLIMLLERSSEVVTREEMRRQLWGDDTFVDFDHGLNVAVNKIREALDDSASRPRFVETVSGKGYRFIAPVMRPMPVEAEEAPNPATATVQPPAAVAAPEPATPGEIAPGPITGSPSVEVENSGRTILTAPDELPHAPRKLVRILLLLVQGMYLSFYVGALANLAEIHEIFVEADFPPAPLMAVLITTGAVLIPVRLFIFAAVALNFQQFPKKFGNLFPVLLILDLLWALSPFLLIHHLNAGLALSLSAPLVYSPFAQRSLVLMYARDASR